YENIEHYFLHKKGKNYSLLCYYPYSIKDVICYLSYVLGGFVLTGGIIGFLLSRNPATLTSGVLFGGALLFLSTLSLKIWKQGKSSLPFILGQAALSGLLIWKNFQSYSLAKKLFPTGFSAIISSAMLCFYLYVLISGGNPPPKKLKPSASTA
ncbi:PREDICTED: protein FATTY ACID EXPORT 1, chloroplastic-like, partial [Lupinus angustifolius]|uniref:protein FATTY ACID EXPORT 1, chloroplastic-like n=1 Tax=Lupinus angustifolius TaxID=3871 RepID=UPI00092E3088